jgi:hypothetical protein
VIGPSGITAVLFSFSKPLDPTRAQDLGNYGYYAISAGPDGTFGTPDDGFIPLAAAQYDAASATVAVIPAAPLPLNRFERITIDALANPILKRGLADTSGVLLSGLSNGIAGSPFVATFGAGTQLAYSDSQGKNVSLSLSGGGIIEMFRGPGGNDLSVRLVGTIPHRSVLSLRADNAGGRYTYLPPIQGAVGVRFRYRTPPSVFRSTPLAPAAKTSHARIGDRRRK